MQSASSSSIKESKSVKERSSKTPAKRAKASKRSKDSDKKAEQSLIDVEASMHHGDANESEQSLIADNTSDDESQVSTCGEDQTFGQGKLKNVNEYFKGKVGTDILAKHWLKDCKLSSLEKSMVILGLAYELCLAKDPDYDLENEAAENNKQNNFNTKRIFHILKYVTAKVLPEDRKKFTEFVCKSSNVKLLEMICRQENKDGGGNAQVDRQYSWKGEFTSYERLTDLLQYVLKQPCSPKIVLFIAKKVYGNAHIIYNGNAHIIYNGEQYLNNIQVASIKANFDCPIKDCLRAAIELGCKDVVPVMLGGDIYHYIRLMKGKEFQEEKEALKMIEETVAEVMSSWVNCKQDLSKKVKGLLKKGVEVDISKMGKKDLIDAIEYLGIEVKNKVITAKKELVEKLMKEGGGKVRLRLSKTVVGALISALFFNYQNELTKELFELKISKPDESRREKEINELNENINDESFVKEKVLEKIKSLNSSSHMRINWFFREVLTAIVNDKEKLGKLKAVCTAICKEKVEELLEGAEVHEDVADALKFFGVKPNQIKTSTPKKGHSVVSVPSHFSQEIEETDKALREVKGIVREMNKWGNESSEYEILSLVKILLSDKTPAFSGLSRKTIVELKSKKKKDITNSEIKKLKEAVDQILGEIKKGIGMLAKGDSEYCIDTEDISKHFEIINSEIEKEDKREIVELVCQKGNVELLEMICRQENYVLRKKHKGGVGNTGVGYQYLWKGEFTGYERLTDLLQYVLKQPCSPEIVLCIVKKVYGTAHIIYNGEQYLDGRQVASFKGKFDYPIKDCLKAAIELGYKNVVLVMLGGDIYHCIRLMKGGKFQEEFSEVLKMIEETVVEVMSSWVEDKDQKRESFKDDVQHLLKEGIKVCINKMKKKDLINELESRGIEVKEKSNATVKELVEMLKKKGEGKVRISKIVVGSLISTLFFNCQNELMKKPFKLGISPHNQGNRREEINELDENIDKEGFLEKKVLEKIKLLNSYSHISNNWFFREVLSAIVNDEERFNKLQAVCTAICKEPMERLLRGAKVHEDVVDILEFFGVDPLVLEKSMTSAPENSNVVPSRNIPSFSSNSRSEKGTSDELRQPSADAELTSDDCSSTSHDPLKISITPAKMAPEVKVLSPVSPSSKAAEEKNKGFMQTSCGQGENSSYNKGENSHRHSGEVRSISRRLDMIGGINLKAIDKKKKEASIRLRARGLLGKVGRQMNACPPSVQQLLDANRMMYMEKSLDEVILNYNTLSYNSLYESNLLDRSLNESSSEEAQELYDLFESSSNFIKYENAVDKLVNGNVVAAKRMLLDLVNDAVEPACYAYVLVFFKEIIRQCDVLNNTTTNVNVEVMEKSKDEIDTIIQLLKRASLMEPASSFLLGMMKRYNIGECSKFMDGSWEDDLIHVVNVVRDYRFFNIEQYILKGIDPDRKWSFERCGLGIQKKHEYLKEMGKYSLYEITLSVLSRQHFDADVLNDLFQILSEDKFPEVLYSYGAALLQVKVGKTFEENIKEAMEYLNLAASVGHEGAKFLLGTLPFNNKVSCTLTSDEVKCCICKLEDYINNSDGSCLINEENIDKAAHCLAVEYYAKRSHLVRPDKQKAEKILDSRKLHKQLHDLQSQVEPSFTLDDSSTISPSSAEQTFSPLFSSSKIRDDSSSGFSSDCSTIEKTPIPTKLSSTSAENQSGLGR